METFWSVRKICFSHHKNSDSSIPSPYSPSHILFSNSLLLCVFLVPQQGKVLITTEFGKMMVEPNEICVIQVRSVFLLPYKSLIFCQMLCHVCHILGLKKKSHCTEISLSQKTDYQLSQHAFPFTSSSYVVCPARDVFQCGCVWRNQRLHTGGVWSPFWASWPWTHRCVLTMFVCFF